ncbi:MAG: response regulator [Pseudomonadota bacterium]
MDMTIVIVEDEEKLATLLQEYLQQAGYRPRVYHDGTHALEEIPALSPDLIVLDLMLPGTDGMTICKELRKTSSVPIIMTTAKVEEIDRLLGLEIGADDYICKPYSPREVVARVKAVLRRGQAATAPAASDDFNISVDEALVTIKGSRIDLTAVELNLLQTMAETPGRIFSRNQLMTRIYPDNRIVSDRTIDSHVKKLRQRLALLAPEDEYIHSVYGLGYKFELPEPG